MESFFRESKEDFEKRWVFKDGNNIVGKIERHEPDIDFFLTHSSIKHSKSLWSSHTESGSIANFIFVLKGELSIDSTAIRGNHKIKEGEAYAFLTDNSEVARKSLKDKEAELFLIKISRNKFENILKDTDSPFRIANKGISSASLSPYDTEIVRDIVLKKYRGETGKMFMMSKAVELLANTFLGMGDRSESIVLDVASQIRENLSSEHNLEGIAKMAGMSHTKLNLLFKKKFGLTVFEFIRREKITIAENLLKNSNMTVTEIAHNTGFCSSSHFCNSFRKERGISPKDFRLRTQ